MKNPFRRKRQGRVLTESDFTEIGLSAPVKLYNLGNVPFAPGITGEEGCVRFCSCVCVNGTMNIDPRCYYHGDGTRGPHITILDEETGIERRDL